MSIDINLGLYTDVYSANPGIPVGTIWTQGIRKFIFCHSQSTSTSITAKKCVYQLAAGAVGEITDDVANSKRNLCLGIAPATVAAGYYFWSVMGIETLGTIPVATAGAITAGALLVAATSSNLLLAVANGTAPTYKVLGVVLVGKASGTAVITARMCAS